MKKKKAAGSNRAQWREFVVTKNAGKRTGRGVKEMAGLKFGRLEVIGRAEVVYKMMQWHCRCECGAEVIIPGSNLRKGKTQSCGCLRREVAAAWGKAMAERIREVTGSQGTKLKKVRKRTTGSTKAWQRKEVKPPAVKAGTVPVPVLRPAVVVAAEVKVKCPQLMMARAMRQGGARWSEVLEVTGLKREEVEEAEAGN